MKSNMNSGGLGFEEIAHALGIPAKAATEVPHSKDIWGDYGFDSWGAQLVSVGGTATVLYKQGRTGAVLHEACHGVFGSMDETLIFAYEYLVARDLVANDRRHWKNHFRICVVMSDGTEGSAILSGRKLPKNSQRQWDRALSWLQKNGYTHRGRPVYGFGQCSDFAAGLAKFTFPP